MPRPILSLLLLMLATTTTGAVGQSVAKSAADVAFEKLAAGFPVRPVHIPREPAV